MGKNSRGKDLAGERPMRRKDLAGQRLAEKRPSWEKLAGKRPAEKRPSTGFLVKNSLSLFKDIDV